MVDNDEDVLAAVNLKWFPDGAPVSLAALFGNSVTLDGGGKVTGAKAMVQVGDGRPDVPSNRQGGSVFISLPRASSTPLDLQPLESLFYAEMIGHGLKRGEQ